MGIEAVLALVGAAVGGLVWLFRLQSDVKSHVDVCEYRHKQQTISDAENKQAHRDTKEALAELQTKLDSLRDLIVRGRQDGWRTSSDRMGREGS